MTEKKFVIIVPHYDDELIGCFSLLSKKLVVQVYYINCLEEQRAKAKIIGRHYEFEPIFIDFKDFYKNFRSMWQKEFIYLVPDITERHPLHRMVNMVVLFSGCLLGYYSTQMETSYVRLLSKEVAKMKKEALDNYYPEEQSLWQFEHKYYLYEGICIIPSYFV